MLCDGSIYPSKGSYPQPPEAKQTPVARSEGDKFGSSFIPNSCAEFIHPNNSNHQFQFVCIC